MSYPLRHLALLSVLLLALTACAGNKEENKLPPDESVEVLYNKATSLMDQKEYKSAAKAFAEVERQHPYSSWAARAQLMEGYAYYQNLDYEEAIKALDQFIELHPGNDDIAYANYLRAISFYERIADVRRDQNYTREALKSLQDIINRFPDTTYAKDAKLKIALVNDHLAGAEMEIGRWYLNQKQYISAHNRFRTVVDKFQTTSHVPEALLRLVETDLALGLPDEAQADAAVLGHNFPGSSWYQDAYHLLVLNKLAKPEEKNWAEQFWDVLF